MYVDCYHCADDCNPSYIPNEPKSNVRQVYDYVAMPQNDGQREKSLSLSHQLLDASGRAQAWEDGQDALADERGGCGQVSGRGKDRTGLPRDQRANQSGSEQTHGLQVEITPELAYAATVAGVGVSPAMILAGVATLRQSGLVDDPSGADTLVVAEIYRAMIEEFSFSQRHGAAHGVPCR